MCKLSASDIIYYKWKIKQYRGIVEKLSSVNDICNAKNNYKDNEITKQIQYFEEEIKRYKKLCGIKEHHTRSEL